MEMIHLGKQKNKITLEKLMSSFAAIEGAFWKEFSQLLQQQQKWSVTGWQKQLFGSTVFVQSELRKGGDLFPKVVIKSTISYCNPYNMKGGWWGELCNHDCSFQTTAA